MREFKKRKCCDEPSVDTTTTGRSLRMACNQLMADETTPLHEGCEVAFFPPVTGG